MANKIIRSPEEIIEKLNQFKSELDAAQELCVISEKEPWDKNSKSEYYRKVWATAFIKYQTLKWLFE